MRWRRWRRCPHANLRGIYGDEINHVGGRRLQCRDCGRFLDGPPHLATAEPTDPTPKGDADE